MAELRPHRTNEKPKDQTGMGTKDNLDSSAPHLDLTGRPPPPSSTKPPRPSDTWSQPKLSFLASEEATIILNESWMCRSGEKGKILFAKLRQKRNVKPHFAPAKPTGVFKHRFPRGRSSPTPSPYCPNRPYLQGNTSWTWSC